MLTGNHPLFASFCEQILHCFLVWYEKLANKSLEIEYHNSYPWTLCTLNCVSEFFLWIIYFQLTCYMRRLQYYDLTLFKFNISSPKDANIKVVYQIINCWKKGLFCMLINWGYLSMEYWEHEIYPSNCQKFRRLRRKMFSSTISLYFPFIKFQITLE